MNLKLDHKPLYQLADEWLDWLSASGAEWRTWSSRIYADAELEQVALLRFRLAAQSFGERYGPGRAFVMARVPGRVHIMGRHIEPCGGPTVTAATAEELVVAGSLINRPVIEISSSSADFGPPQTASLSDFVPLCDTRNWDELIEHPAARMFTARHGGQMILHAAGALLRMWCSIPELRRYGLQMHIDGNLPPTRAMGLRPAVVVASILAVMGSAELQIQPLRLLSLCEDAGHLSGTADSLTDFAAILLAERDRLLPTEFTPLQPGTPRALPQGISLIVADSGQYPERLLGVREVFAARQGQIERATRLLREAHAELRDAASPLQAMLGPDPEVNAGRVLPMLLGLPYGTPSESGERAVTLRDVGIYAASEICRARLFLQALDADNRQMLGGLSTLSHEGDRVSQFIDDEEEPYCLDFGDESLADLASSDLPLWMIPGRYATSTRLVDWIVDQARAVGALCAQVSGAGMGGAAVLLAEREMTEPLCDMLRTRIYVRTRVHADIRVIRPSSGACCLG
jgi:N-acetylgalactosamine kinase